MLPRKGSRKCSREWSRKCTRECPLKLAFSVLSSHTKAPTRVLTWVLTWVPTQVYTKWFGRMSPGLFFHLLCSLAIKGGFDFLRCGLSLFCLYEFQKGTFRFNKITDFDRCAWYIQFRLFFLSDNSIWSYPSVSSLSDYSIWRSWRLFYTCDHSIWSIWVHCPQILLSLRKNGQEESRLLSLRRLRSSRFAMPHPKYLSRLFLPSQIISFPEVIFNTLHNTV